MTAQGTPQRSRPWHQLPMGGGLAGRLGPPCRGAGRGLQPRLLEPVLALAAVRAIMKPAALRSPAVPPSAAPASQPGRLLPGMRPGDAELVSGSPSGALAAATRTAQLRGDGTSGWGHGRLGGRERE